MEGISNPGDTYDYDKKKNGDLPIGAIIGIVVGCVVVVVGIAVIRKRNKDNGEKQNDSDGGEKKEEKNDDL